MEYKDLTEDQQVLYDIIYSRLKVELDKIRDEMHKPVVYGPASFK